MSPGMLKKSPTMVPTTAPARAAQLAPTRFAPRLAAMKSTTKVSTVRIARTLIVNQPTFSKRSAQAATSSPRKTSGAPGIAGSTVPTTPTTTSATASSMRTGSVSMTLLSLRLDTHLEPAAEDLPAQLQVPPLVQFAVQDVVMVGHDPA